VNRAEEFVAELCKRTFLSLWSYPNPKTKNKDRELCDVLVVCDPDVVIISVKEIGFKDTGRTLVDWKRWHREAIEKSVDQIYGAERYINRNEMKTVVSNEGKQGLPIPAPSKRRIWRVAVALGSQEKAPIYPGDFGKGFVHVFDEKSFEIVIKELDTITDFIRYLDAKETLLSPTEVLMEGGEEDLLASYLANNREFPKGGDILVVTDDWEEFYQSQDYKNKKREDKVSYWWDRLIERVSRYFETGTLEYGNSPEAERVIRIMAREDRFSRRILSKYFWEFMRAAGKGEVRSRTIPSPSGVSYVFQACPHGEDREYRKAELGCRCFIVRGMYPNNKTVVGIATERYIKGKGVSFDLTLFHKEKWTEEDRRTLQKETGFFKNPRETHLPEDEYPQEREQSGDSPQPVD